MSNPPVRISTEPTFFGIGAQKAGTTWLYKVLASYPDCAPLPVKEMHFFDAKYVSGARASNYSERFSRLASLTSRLEAVVQRKLQKADAANRIYYDGFLSDVDLGPQLERIVTLAERLQVCDIDSYVKYMETWRDRSHGKLVGEITPAYSVLPKEGFEEIDSRFPRAKFIFIMRDPIDRFWSQVRFFVSQRKKPGNPNALVSRLINRDDFRTRSDYRRTIETIEAVVPGDRIHYAFFENLTAPAKVIDEMRRLEHFLGLSPLPVPTLESLAQEPTLPSPKSAMSDENRRLVLEHFRPLYAFLESKFGALPGTWAKP